MGRKLFWTRPQEVALVRMRAQGTSWDGIAAALNISRNAATERGRRLGARLPPRKHAKILREDPDRPPLKPGHPATWGVLTAGTVLANEPYPTLPPMGRDRAGVVGEVC